MQKKTPHSIGRPNKLYNRAVTKDHCICARNYVIKLLCIRIKSTSRTWWLQGRNRQRDTRVRVCNWGRRERWSEGDRKREKEEIVKSPFFKKFKIILLFGFYLLKNKRWGKKFGRYVQVQVHCPSPSIRKSRKTREGCISKEIKMIMRNALEPIE